AYEYLRVLIQRHGLYLAVPPELAQSLESLHVAGSRAMEAVIHDQEELAYRVKLELARRDPEATDGSAADFIGLEHDLALLLKAADLQADEYEVRDFGPRLDRFILLAQTLDPSSTADLRRLVSSSIDFYALTLMRNKPMVENTLRL